MARKQIRLVEEVISPEERLSVIVPNYQANKTEMDSYKKLVDADNKEIKEIMLGHEMEEFEIDDIKAKVSVSERINFIEEALIGTLKSLGVEEGIIKTKEYVDMQALEDAIYKGVLNAAEIAHCQDIREVVTLRISKVKRK